MLESPRSGGKLGQIMTGKRKNKVDFKFLTVRKTRGDDFEILLASRLSGCGMLMTCVFFFFCELAALRSKIWR